MSDAKGANSDPSMDDILASIRKIISDDEARTQVGNQQGLRQSARPTIVPPVESQQPTATRSPGRDDVLLLELAWPALAEEADEYEDFRSYRESEHPDGDGSARRASWIRDRLAALALLQHQARVNEGRYVESNRNVEPFRVGG